MSRWFRHYAGMMRDEKLVRVALRSKQPIERVIWMWGAILESAAEINDGGRYDIEPAEFAHFLGAPEADIRLILDGLTEAKRVADGAVVKWGDRQFQSDKSATRQAAYRERKRANGSGNNDQQTSRDGGVTATSRRSDGPETETETETEKINEIGARPPMVAPEAHELADAFLNAIGQSDPLDITPEFAGTLMRADVWHRAGWPREMIVAEAKRVMEGRPAPPGMKYFEKVFANKFASLNAPVPEGKPTSSAHATTENLSAVARKFAASGITFGPKPSLGGSRNSPDGPPVRLLPEG